MTFKAAKCPNCAGDIQVPDDRDNVKCMYCGSDIIVREAIKAAAGGVNVEALLTLAKEAQNPNGRYGAGVAYYNAEAYQYYSKVLEHEQNNVAAWIGRAFSGHQDYQTIKSSVAKAITQSSDRESVTREIVTFFENSLAYAIDSRHVSLHSISYQEIAWADIILDYDPNNTLALIMKGAASYQEAIRRNSGRQDAIGYFEKALTLAKENQEMSERLIYQLKNILGVTDIRRLNEVILSQELRTWIDQRGKKP